MSWFFDALNAFANWLSGFVGSVFQWLLEFIFAAVGPVFDYLLEFVGFGGALDDIMAGEIAGYRWDQGITGTILDGVEFANNFLPVAEASAVWLTAFSAIATVRIGRWVFACIPTLGG